MLPPRGSFAQRAGQEFGIGDHLSCGIGKEFTEFTKLTPKPGRVLPESSTLTHYVLVPEVVKEGV